MSEQINILNRKVVYYTTQDDETIPRMDAFGSRINYSAIEFKRRLSERNPIETGFESDSFEVENFGTFSL